MTPSTRLFAAAVEARAKVAPAKAILDESRPRWTGSSPAMMRGTRRQRVGEVDRIAAEQKLSDEIARQEAEEVAKQQAAYTPKHLAGTDTAQPGSLAQTGDRAGLIGETFVIGGTVLRGSRRLPRSKEAPRADVNQPGVGYRLVSNARFHGQGDRCENKGYYRCASGVPLAPQLWMCQRCKARKRLYGKGRHSGKE